MVRILLVDDDLVDRKRCRRLLDEDSQHSYELTEVGSGDEALALISQRSFDCVLIDYQLPDFDGIELANAITGEDAPPLVMLTGEGSEEIAVDAMKSGYQDYVSKDRVSARGLARAIWNAVEKAELARSAREARAAAELANQAKSQFLAHMSHEIRTPMTAILGFAETLTDPCLVEEERTQATRMILINGNHLLDLINDILDVSKIEAGRLEIELQKVSPRELLEQVQEMMEPRAREQELALTVEFETAVPRVFDSDPTRLRQILINLVGNAIKFTAEGSVRLVASLHQDEGQASLHLSVRDTGLGIDDETKERLFQPFTQADASTTRRFGGTGLGLVISQKLASLLGGHIDLESEPGQGSDFRVVLPCGPVAELELLELSTINASTNPPKRKRAEAADDLSGLNILVAEDVAANQMLIKHLLTRAGANVTVVENGSQAVDTVQALEESGERFDVILMDMLMPVLDGYQATQQLRSAGYSGAIIALTANAFDSERRKAFEMGCDEVATKPIDRAHLFAAILAHKPQA